MPAYFSMTLHFENKRLNSNFVRTLYSKIISCGFDFKSGYWFHENAKLEEIINWNQKLLEQGFRLGYTQHVRNDYIQILFSSEIYSELRGFWMYSDSEITFNLIIPEYDILNTEGGDTFISGKINPIRNLALELWKENLADAIQTSLELDCGYSPLEEIFEGINLSVNPFAIINADVYKSFSKDFFFEKIIGTIENKGIFIENKEKSELASI